MRLRAASCLLAVLIGTAACGPADPIRLAGEAAPITATVPSAATSSPANLPTATSTSPAATGAALPAEFETYRLTAAGATLTVPVPAGWAEYTSGNGRRDFRDPTDTILLRIELSRSTGNSARAGWESASANARNSLDDYRLLDITDVPDVGVSAADWTFTYRRDGVLRKVIDRGLVLGGNGVAIYYSAPAGDYERLLPVWTRAVQGFRVG